MPELKPFRGLRYSAAERLKDLTCPPYDVISEDLQRELHARHPNNAVRLELAMKGTHGYEGVATTLEEWIRSGILARDDEESFYVYRQDFIDAGGSRRHVTGVLGALTLEPFGSTSGVLPHERTMPGPIRDRLALLRACPVNVSPIYAIYRGGGRLASFFSSLEDRPTAARFVDDAGVLHRMWMVLGGAEQDHIQGAMEPGPLVIADGHHRYETALAFHDEMRGSPGHHDAIMCFSVDADSEELVVLPYHRAFRTTRSAGEIASRLESGFTAADTHDPLGDLGASRADHAYAFLFDDRTLLVEVDAEQVRERLGNRAAAWAALDVVALHEAILPEAAGSDLELTFERDPDRIAALIAAGWTGGILMRPVAPAQIVDVARSGERMPQKASFFWPKATTGLVFRTLR